MVEKLGISQTTEGKWVVYTGNPGEGGGKIIFARPKQVDKSIVRAVEKQNQKAQRGRKRQLLVGRSKEMRGAIMVITRRETAELEAEMARPDRIDGERIDREMAEEGRKITDRFDREEHIA